MASLSRRLNSGYSHISIAPEFEAQLVLTMNGNTFQPSCLGMKSVRSHCLILISCNDGASADLSTRSAIAGTHHLGSRVPETGPRRKADYVESLRQYHRKVTNIIISIEVDKGVSRANYCPHARSPIPKAKGNLVCRAQSDQETDIAHASQNPLSTPATGTNRRFPAASRYGICVSVLKPTGSRTRPDG